MSETNSTVIGTAPEGSMAWATRTVIRDEVRMEYSKYMPNVLVIEVPGLSYYSTPAEAFEAVRLLRLGQYPLVHGPVRRNGDL